MKYHIRALRCSFIFFVSLVVFSLINVSEVKAFSGNGDGSELDPYEITTCDQFQEINLNELMYYELLNDINGADCTEPFAMIPNFSGHFNGNGNTIAFEINHVADGDNVGLFRVVDGTITSLSITGSINVTGHLSQIGSLIGTMYGSDITKIASNVTITASNGNFIGGIVGGATYSSISDSYYVGEIRGIYQVGGILGWAAQDMVIDNVYAGARLRATQNAVAGLVGEVSAEFTISDSFAFVRPRSKSEIGAILADIADEATINMSSIYYGTTYLPPDTPCYYTETIPTSNPDCHSINLEVTPDHFRSNDESPVFSNWDFDNDWEVTDGQYPYLRSQDNFPDPDLNDVIDISGEGTQASPYVLDTCIELQQINENMSAHYRLATDLDCGDDLDQIGGVNEQYFEGTLDGDNHTLKYAFTSQHSDIGLFYGLDENGVIKNLVLDATIDSQDANNHISGLAIYANGSRLENITGNVSINLAGFYIQEVAGLVGRGSVTVTDCDVNVQMDIALQGFSAYAGKIGGIIGQADSSLIENTTITGHLNIGTESRSYIEDIGGILGYEEMDTKLNSVASVFDITIQRQEFLEVKNVGGLAGVMCDDSGVCDIDNSTWYGGISIAANYVESIGGLVGSGYFDYEFYTSKLSQNSASGSIVVNYENIATEIGGLFGYVEDVDVYYNNSWVDILVLTTDEAPVARQIGGIAGEAENVRIVDSYSRSNLTVQTVGDAVEGIAGEVGGLFGRLDGGQIFRSYAQGGLTYGIVDNNIELNEEIGGLVGVITDYTTIKDSFAVMEFVLIDGVDSVGGIVGYDDYYLIVENSYFDSAKTGVENCVTGNVLPEVTPENCIAVNTDGSQPDRYVENSSAAPLNNWNFVGVWRVHEGEYPLLRDDIDTTNEEHNYSNGNGSQGNPYQVKTCVDLQGIDSNLDAYYVLTNDINCQGFAFSPIGSTIGEFFTGSLNGNNYTISNVAIDRRSDEFIGIFGVLYGARIENLKLANIFVNGYSEVGGLAGTAEEGTIINNIRADVRMDYCSYACGGLVGRVNREYEQLVEISNVNTEIDFDFDNVDYSDSVGGVIGMADNLSLNSSSAKGLISTGAWSNYAIGGLVGLLYNDSDTGMQVTESYADVDILINHNEAWGSYIGGLLGYVESYYITDVYSTSNIIISGELTDIYYVAGLAAYTYLSTIENSYSAGSISINSGSIYGLGGLLALSYLDVELKNVFSATNIDISGVQYMVNVADVVAEDYYSTEFDNVYYDGNLANLGSCTNNDSVAGECVAIFTEKYFKGNKVNPPLNLWDFNNVWLVINNKYPQLLTNLEDTDPNEEEPNNETENNQQPPSNSPKPTTSRNQTNTNEVKITLNDFAEYFSTEGKELNLKVGQIIYFNVTNDAGAIEEHTVTVVSIDGNSVVITIASTPSDYTLNVGQTVEDDVDDSGDKDIAVTLVGTQNDIATMNFREIAESTPESSPALQPVNSGGNLNTDTDTSYTSEQSQPFNWWILLIILALVAGGYYIHRRNKVRSAKISYN